MALTFKSIIFTSNDYALPPREHINAPKSLNIRSFHIQVRFSCLVMYLKHILEPWFKKLKLFIKFDVFVSDFLPTSLSVVYRLKHNIFYLKCPIIVLLVHQNSDSVVQVENYMYILIIPASCGPESWALHIESLVNPPT